MCRTMVGLSAAVALMKTTTTIVSLSSLVQAKDMFLFSGQSNMEGYTNWKEAKNPKYLSDVSQLEDVVKIVSDPTTEAKPWRKKAQIRKRLGQSNKNQSVTNFMVSEIMALYRRDLLNNLTDPVAGAECSFVTKQPITNGTVPVSFDSMCGRMFGHELLFAKSLKEYWGYRHEIAIHKAAVGGKKMDFFQNKYWSTLQETIYQYAGQGLWKGFVWHQGTQDTHDGNTYRSYGKNLKRLVHKIRLELCRANAITKQVSHDTCDKDALDIPVVIVQLGYWPRYDFEPYRAQVVRDAQASFCETDPRAALVVTNDLSRFFHFDAASFLISGNRIAHAMMSLLQPPDDKHVCFRYKACAQIAKREICQDDACSSSCAYNETMGGCFEYLSADAT